jgi:geranylgeranyl reductase family protein
MRDVIVVGAGCVGNYMGRLLAEQGRDVLVLEKDRRIGDSVNCSGIIGSEAFEKLDIPKDATQSQLREIKVFGPSGCSFMYQPSEPWAEILDRVKFDQQMAKMAEKRGCEFLLESWVNSVEIDDEGVSLTVRCQGGLKKFRAKVCVMALGFGAKFIQEAGLGKIENYIQGVQATAQIKDVENVEIYLGNNVAPGSFGWVVPIDEGLCKIGLLATKKGGGHLRQLIEGPFLSPRVQFWDGMYKASLIPLGVLPKTSTKRLLVVGEAAGQVKTTTAGGIYYGFLCAKIASETIDQAFREGDFSEEVMEVYDKRWRALLGPELRAGIALRNIFLKMSDKQIDALVNFAKYDGIIPMVNNVFQFDWHAPLISDIIKKYLSSPASKKISVFASLD